jgi:ribosome maturation factor RimP
MAINRRLQTDRDFQEALEKQVRIRVFKDDHMVDSGGILVRFDEQIIALQSSVSDLIYHPRALCEFFEMKKR